MPLPPPIKEAPPDGGATPDTGENMKRSILVCVIFYAIILAHKKWQKRTTSVDREVSERRAVVDPLDVADGIVDTIRDVTPVCEPV